ncbi:hypothetical protein [Ruania rhizosphaerae]|uniref:hypothetical protein n=1 Tax=Ruania rhizosphaerae TaxID=1840413 RepID=UPI00135A480B|nr:hypothetical protein [Ruania rhizosphaerae]
MEREITHNYTLATLVKDVAPGVAADEAVASLNSPVAEVDQIEKRVTTLVNGLVRGRIRKTNNGFGDCPHETLELARSKFLAHVDLSSAEVAEMAQTAAGNGIDPAAQTELLARAAKVGQSLSALATEVTLEAAAIHTATKNVHPSADARDIRDRVKPVALARALARLASRKTYPELPVKEGRLLGDNSGEALSHGQLATTRASGGVLFDGWDEETKRQTLGHLFKLGVRHAQAKGLSPFDAEDVAARALEKCLRPGEEAKRLQIAYFSAAVRSCINDVHNRRSSISYLDDLTVDIPVQDEDLGLSEQLESGLRGAAGCNKNGCLKGASAEEVRAHREIHIIGDIAVEAMKRQLDARERGSITNTRRIALEAASDNKAASALDKTRALGRKAAEAIIRFGGELNEALSDDDGAAA